MSKTNVKASKKAQEVKVQKQPESNQLLEKLTPYIFPTIALLIVVFLTFRWYNMRTDRNGEVSPFAEGVEIENLTESELSSVLKGTKDLKTVKMIANSDVTGEIRYEIKNGRVLFTVNAQLPEEDGVAYQVWLKSLDKDDYRRAFVLDYGKAGFYGSAALSEEVLPFEVVVSKELNNDEQLEEVLLTGVINK